MGSRGLWVRRWSGLGPLSPGFVHPVKELGVCVSFTFCFSEAKLSFRVGCFLLPLAVNSGHLIRDPVLFPGAWVVVQLHTLSVPMRPMGHRP